MNKMMHLVVFFLVVLTSNGFVGSNPGDNDFTLGRRNSTIRTEINRTDESTAKIDSVDNQQNVTYHQLTFTEKITYKAVILISITCLVMLSIAIVIIFVFSKPPFLFAATAETASFRYDLNNYREY